MPAKQHSVESGLTSAEAAERLRHYGPNTLPEHKPPSLAVLFLRQFLNPLIYILVIATGVSLALGDLDDALFIAVVLLFNGIIGAMQEYSASKAAAALKKLEHTHAIVIRDNREQQIDSIRIVPGDVMLLEAGSKIAADAQLLHCYDLQCDESLLTGESQAVRKEQGQRCYAGSMVVRGRGLVQVTATGLASEIGRIAEQINRKSLSKPPLLLRMERFTRNIAIAICIAIILLAVMGLLRGMAFRELLMMSLGLAVSAIPEGLPVAITVALAIAMQRMASSHVIIRNLPAVEALGSCTLIATDKTGTLTMNELTVTDILLPDGTELSCETGQELDACRIRSTQEEAHEYALRLLRAATLPNEGHLHRRQDHWEGIGDTVDIALLAAAHKGGLKQEQALEDYPLLHRIPYEPDLRYAASFHETSERVRIFVKGAPEALLAMCSHMEVAGQALPIDKTTLLEHKRRLTQQGLRVLAFAEGEISDATPCEYGHQHLMNLTFLGMAGMQDPIRPEVPQAIADAGAAGILVAMITGDDPHTAASIAERAGLTVSGTEIVTGEEISQAEALGEAALDALTRSARIYARVAPAQKLAIVLSLARNGHFVAVTGDGVNDAPALKHAHVGVAMGRNGTDVAKESADIILTDDNFASIIAGIREGRVAYANIRKLIFLLTSTGAAEMLLFLLAMLLGSPMPFFAVQLLWLNLVTNGIQDVALACEKPEGDELVYSPRKPSEPIFDRLMLRRIIISTLVMGVGGFAGFWWLLQLGYDEAHARNLLLLLFVLFENFQCFNARSEHHSAFRQKLRANPFLIASVITAQGLHIAAMYIPVLANTLHIMPISASEWLGALFAAGLLFLAVEGDKLLLALRLKRI